MEAWRDQWQRMERWNRRIWRHYAPRDGNEPHDPDWVGDDLRAFFVTAYHLKDWLINDPAVVVPKEEIEGKVTDSTWIALAADICNGVKHLRLKPKRRRSQKDPAFGYGRTRVDADGRSQLLHYQLLMNDGSEIDALNLSQRVVDEWRYIVREWGLDPYAMS